MMSQITSQPHRKEEMDGGRFEGTIGGGWAEDVGEEAVKTMMVECLGALGLGSGKFYITSALAELGVKGEGDGLRCTQEWWKEQ